jgi:hypothetical protein
MKITLSFDLDSLSYEQQLELYKHLKDKFEPHAKQQQDVPAHIGNMKMRDTGLSTRALNAIYKANNYSWNCNVGRFDKLQLESNQEGVWRWGVIHKRD